MEIENKEYGKEKFCIDEIKINMYVRLFRTFFNNTK